MVTELLPLKFAWAGLSDEDPDAIETNSPDTDLDDTDGDDDDDAPSGGSDDSDGTEAAEPLE